MSAVAVSPSGVVASSAATDLERSTMRRVTWRILPLLFVLYVAAFLDRVNIGIASLRMNQDIGLSPAAFGLGSGIFFLGYSLFEVPSNVLLARVGARWWIARIAITWGLLASAMAFVQGPTSFFVLRLLLGFAEAGFFPGVIYYFTHWFPETRRARATSMLTIGIPVSLLIGGPLGAALLGLSGILGLAGWQWLYLVEGLPPILLGLAVLRWLPDRPSSATWLPAPEREWLERELARGNATHAKVAETVWSAVSNPTAWWLCAPYLLYNICGYAMVIWGPQVVRNLLHVSDQRVGLIMGVIGLVGVASMLGSAALSDRRKERVIHGSIALLIVSIGLSIVAAGAPAMIAVVALACAVVSNNAFLPVFWCLPQRFLRGAGAAAGIALINSVGNLGGFIGPTVVGTVKTMTGGFTGGFAVLAGMSFLSALLMLTLARSSALGARAAPAVDQLVQTRP